MCCLCKPEGRRETRSERYLAPQTGFGRGTNWFYKRGCQEKKLSRELEAAKSFGIQPPCCCAGPRGVAARAWLVLKDSEMFKCQGHKFPNPPFPHIRKGSSERPGAVKGAPFRRGAANP